MKLIFRKFHNCESGAVSTDWVVLTAAIVLLAVVVSTAVKDGAISAGDSIGADLTAMATP